MLELINITKNYQIRKDKIQTVLRGIHVTFSNKGFVSILGSSGNGKTTLLNVIGGLDEPDSGKICFNGEEIVDFEKFRRERVGYVFQQFNLIEHLSAVDNVIVSMNDDISKKKEKAKKILKDLGLESCLNKLPRQLSGGQKQRIAIARMIAKDVDIIICDEPTGSLDEETERHIVKIIKELSKEKLVLFVTHNRKIAYEYSDRIIEVHRGQLEETDQPKNDLNHQEKNHARSYKKNTLWLAIKSILGRMKFTIKYLLLTTFILLVASLAFILEGEFFKKYMHENAVDEGIMSLVFDVSSEDVLEDIRQTPHVLHATLKHNKTIGVAASNYESTRTSTEVLFEDITGNEYMKTILSDGRYPEKPDEVLMTAKGVISLLKELNIGGERLYDQYMTGEISSEYVFSLIDWKQFFIVEYGMPRVKIVGLIDDTQIHEAYQQVYYIEGFFDLFEFPGSLKANQVKVYKDDLYLESHQMLIDEITEDETITVDDEYNHQVLGLYSHIDSFLKLSKMTLYLVMVIAGVSFLSLLYTSLFERKYEIGLYRALGYSRRSIRKVLAYEMLMICMMSLVLVIVLLNVFSYVAYSNLDYYNSFMEILNTLNILGIVGSLVVIITMFTIIIVSTGNYMILRKSVLSNINDL